MSNQVKVITMYSFKGGSGRTVCTANIATFMSKALGATRDHPLLIMDMDLDSAGLTTLLGLDKSFSERVHHCSSLLQKKFDIGNKSHQKSIFDEKEGLVDVSRQFGAEPGTIRFLGTPVVGLEEYTHVRQDSAKQMRYFLDLCGDRQFVGVLIDSASGRQETAQLCHRVSDLVVYCFRLTEQFVYGTGHYLNHFIKVCEDEQQRIPAILLLPIAVPVVSAKWKQLYEMRIDMMDTWEKQYGKKTSVHLMRPGIPEVEAFKWFESVLYVKKNRSEDESKILHAFQNVATEIHTMLQNDDPGAN